MINSIFRYFPGHVAGNHSDEITMEINLLEKSELHEAARQQVAALFRQLNPDIKQVPLQELFEADNPITIAYCEDNGAIVGIALMCTYKVISGHKGWIEDVVVDEKMRGRGIGKKLMEKLLEVAREKQLSEVLLFSADHRQAAISLYKKLGFQRKDSGLYILKTA
jgi:phosphinothricin acetyltransferase